MTAADRNRMHAEQVTAAAFVVLDPMRRPPWLDVTDDRAELAELLAAVGETWSAALASPATLAEQLRWTRVCVTAQRVAQRLEAEIADEGRAESEKRRPRLVPRFGRGT